MKFSPEAPPFFWAILVSGLTLACTTNNPVKVAPDAVSLSQYLEAHPNSDLQVTDMAGNRFWLYDPVVQNDSLIGVVNRSEPTTLRGIRLDEIQGLAQPHTDVARTVGLGALIFVGMATVSAAVIDDDQGPIYASEVGGWW